MKSLNQTVGDDGEAELGDFVADREAEKPDEIALDSVIAFELKEVLETLSERQRKVLERHYGLNGGEPETFEAIAKSMDLTRERVRQIEEETLKKLAAMRQMQKLRGAV